MMSNANNPRRSPVENDLNPRAIRIKVKSKC